MNRTQKIKKIIKDNLAQGGIKRCIDELNYRRFIGPDGYKGRWTRSQVMAALNGNPWVQNTHHIGAHVPKKVYQAIAKAPGTAADFLREAISQKLRREGRL